MAREKYPTLLPPPPLNDNDPNECECFSASNADLEWGDATQKPPAAHEYFDNIIDKFQQREMVYSMNLPRKHAQYLCSSVCAIVTEFNLPILLQQLAHSFYPSRPVRVLFLQVMTLTKQRYVAPLGWSVALRTMLLPVSSGFAVGPTNFLPGNHLC
ncbi:hypothetical protein GOBAR_AA21429 [Gossypium barbadense]|uniref:Uncharacterized protein n=1 Tax=Gossypium barbadense TaxID=3634 RepID=A0A2P5X7D4_GOSBA|nr:hypothetical protein GOBAR_AA21429 [Gossypium barbadense]